jgi:3-oxoacyl-[acyl-carrier protein] reductase
MKKLEKQVAVVTGSSRGVGAGIARRLAADGARVVINYVQDEKAANQVASDIRAAGGEALVVRADVSNDAQVQQLFQQVDEHYGRLDILVNNAATGYMCPVTDLDRENFQRMIDVNLWGVVGTSVQAIKRMGPAGGRIINISSMTSHEPFPALSVYAMTKGGAEAFTRALALELGPRGITANALVLGWVETDASVNAPDEYKQAFLRRTPLGRLGQPADIADAISLLCSDEARWITGQVIGVNGGIYMVS